ncbi:MAG: anti-sigma factor [Actinomycetota bacterium]|nr:anti-sigma factor [Actinomycetota bacterium]
MNHGRFEELKDTYVLGALTEEERDEFERYLARNPEREAEIDELGAIADLLAISPEQQEPPPELRSRVMEVVEAEAAPRRVRRRPMFAALRGYLDARGIALGAAAMLVIGLLSWNVLLQDQVQNLTDQVEEAQAARQTIPLEGAWAQQGASAEVAAIDEDQVILVAENMPAVPEDQTCQIWVIHDDVPTPSGLFDPDGNMTAAAVTTSIEKADAIAVTVEPAGGSEKPTSDPVLLTEL